MSSSDNLVFVVGLHLFGLVDGAVEQVAGFDGFALLLVFLGVGFGFFGHLFDFGFVEVAGALDGDVLLFASAFVLGGDVQDAVGIDVKGDFDLRDAARGGWDAVEDEAAEDLVVVDHFALTLQDMDFYLWLVVG